MGDDTDVRLFRWNDMPKEKVTDQIHRRVITGERMMMAQVLLDKGAVVPTHSHVHEQISYVAQGVMRFWIGDGEEEMDVGAGEVLHIPSNVPHKAEALEDFVGIDVFSPPREDWLDGTDDYFHRTE